MEHPGQVTKLWRKEAKLSIEKLAQISGIDKGTISRFENKGNFRKKTFDAICKILGRTPHDVYAKLSDRNEVRINMICPDNNPDHISYHATFEDVLHGDPQIAAVAIDCLKAFAARSRASPGIKKLGDYALDKPRSISVSPISFAPRKAYCPKFLEL